MSTSDLFKERALELAKEHASVLAKLASLQNELEQLRGTKAPTLDEHAAPWAEDLNVNQWLSVNVQWVLCACLWLGVFLWARAYIHVARGHCDRLSQVLDQWLPLFLMIFLGYPIFFGFVSHSLPAKTIMDFVTDVVLLVVTARLNVLIPYLAGAFCSVLFLFPVLTALDHKLVAYDYGWYSINVIWTTGASNALTAVAVRRGWISELSRWLGQSLGWPLVMSGGPIVLMLLGQDFSDAYKLNLAQLLRYSTFQVSLYMCIYAGICRNVEIALSETKEDLGRPNNEEELVRPNVVLLFLGLIVQFVNPTWGFPITMLGSVVALASTRDAHKEHLS